jgi:DNA polymerase-3 subunit chi
VGEVGFYHLTATPLDAALPVMLEKALSRGWRAEVRGRDPARLEALDRALWTWREDAFLPHGLAGGRHDARQPVLLTTAPAGEAREALFLVAGAAFDAGEAAARTRVALVFDGADERAVEDARGAWRAATAAGLRAVYWAQEEGGRWTKRRESGG